MTQLFGTCMCWNQNDELSTNQKTYLRQKTTEFSQINKCEY